MLNHPFFRFFTGETILFGILWPPLRSSKTPCLRPFVPTRSCRDNRRLPPHAEVMFGPASGSATPRAPESCPSASPQPSLAVGLVAPAGCAVEIKDRRILPFSVFRHIADVLLGVVDESEHTSKWPTISGFGQLSRGRRQIFDNCLPAPHTDPVLPVILTGPSMLFGYPVNPLQNACRRC